MITLQLEDVPLETAVRIMAESVNLRPVRVGNVLFVCSKTIATELKGDPDINPQPVGPRMTPDGLMMGPGAAVGGFIGGGPGGPVPAIAPPALAPKIEDSKPIPADKADKTDPKKDG